MRVRELLRNLSESLAFVAPEGVCSHTFNYMLFLQGRRPNFHFMAVAEYVRHTTFSLVHYGSRFGRFQLTWRPGRSRTINHKTTSETRPKY
jgi:hypothetical protein